MYTSESEKDALKVLQASPKDAFDLNRHVACILFGGHLIFCVRLVGYKFCPGCLLLKLKLVNINSSGMQPPQTFKRVVF